VFYLFLFFAFYKFIHAIALGQPTLSQKYLIYLFTQVGKKIWIIFLLATSYHLFEKKSYLDICSSLSIFSANFRESFSLTSYKDESNSSYWNAIKISALFTVVIFLFSNLTYTYMNFPISETFRFTLTCKPPTLSINPNNLIHFSKSLVLWCFFQNEVVYGIIRHLLIDSILLFVVPNVLGYRLSFPFGNFLKAKNWNSFMSRMFFFYSMIIYRIFILEFYALLKDIFKINKKSIFKISSILGIFFGAFFYHFFKDFSFFTPSNMKLIVDYPFSPLILLYFTVLAFSSYIGQAFENQKNQRINEFLILILFIFLLIGRSLYDSYRFSVPLDWKIQNILFILLS
jgi:hypothetical protein